MLQENEKFVACQSYGRKMIIRAVQKFSFCANIKMNLIRHFKLWSYDMEKCMLNREKNVFAAFMIMVVCLLSFCITASAESDTTPPVINSIELSAASVIAPGTIIEVIADVTDDLSGVSSLSATFRNGSASLIESHFTHNGYYSNDKYSTWVERNDEKWHALITIKEHQISGTYVLTELIVGDKAGNILSYGHEIPIPDEYKTLTIEVVDLSTLGDTTPPEIEKLVLNKTTFCYGDYIEVLAVITDDLSGVKQAELTFTNGDQFLLVPLFFNRYVMASGREVTFTDGNYHGCIEVPKNYVSGTYELQSITAVDRLNNTLKFSKEEHTLPEKLEAIRFEVYQLSADITRPTVESLTIDKTLVNTPGEIVVAGTVNDNLSGVSDIYVEFKAENGDFLSASLFYNYYIYHDPVTGRIVKESFNDGRWYGYINIGQYGSPGVFKINYVYVRDRADNVQVYGMGTPIPSAFCELQFVVQNDTPDITKPVIELLEIDQMIVNAPGGIIVAGTVSDDLSGVSEAYVQFRTENNDILATSLFRNQVSYRDPVTGQILTKTFNDGRWYGYIDVGKYKAPGLFKIYSARIMDQVGNTQVYGYETPIPDAFSDLQFVVQNDTPDITKPVMESLTIDKIVVKVPEGIVVTGIMSDDLSGVSDINVDVMFRTTNGETLSVQLIYNQLYYRDLVTGEFKTESFNDGKWYGYISISSSLIPGVYRICRASVDDNAGNTQIYGDDTPIPDAFSDLQFEVINPLQEGGEGEDSNFKAYEADFKGLADYVLKRSDDKIVTGDYSGIETSALKYYEKLVRDLRGDIEYCGSTLIIDEDYSITLRQIFRGNPKWCSFLVDGVPVMAQTKDDYIYAEVNGLTFGNLQDSHEFVCLLDGQYDMLIVTASPLSYAYDLLTKQEDSNLQLLAKAMYAAEMETHR